MKNEVTGSTRAVTNDCLRLKVPKVTVNRSIDIRGIANAIKSIITVEQRDRLMMVFYANLPIRGRSANDVIMPVTQLL